LLRHRKTKAKVCSSLHLSVSQQGAPCCLPILTATCVAPAGFIVHQLAAPVAESVRYRAWWLALLEQRRLLALDVFLGVVCVVHYQAPD
jgi:hypothetical protein